VIRPQTAEKRKKKSGREFWKLGRRPAYPEVERARPWVLFLLVKYPSYGKRVRQGKCPVGKNRNAERLEKGFFGRESSWWGPPGRKKERGGGLADAVFRFNEMCKLMPSGERKITVDEPPGQRARSPRQRPKIGRKKGQERPPGKEPRRRGVAETRKRGEALIPCGPETPSWE